MKTLKTNQKAVTVAYIETHSELNILCMIALRQWHWCRVDNYPCQGRRVNKVGPAATERSVDDRVCCRNDESGHVAVHPSSAYPSTSTTSNVAAYPSSPYPSTSTTAKNTNSTKKYQSFLSDALAHYQNLVVFWVWWRSSMHLYISSMC